MIELYPSEFHNLVRSCARLLGDRAASEEVVQDAFIKVFNGNYLPADGAQRSYLRTIVLNGARAELRRRDRAQRRHEIWGRCQRDPHSDVATTVTVAADVRTAIALLPQRQRDVLMLRYFGDASESEIADRLGISCGSVKVHAKRGLDALRSALTLT